jgi:hypothetical protein
MAQQANRLESILLRERLMSANPTQRVAALHALEREVGQPAGAASARLVSEVENFTARGIPFYASDDPHYLAWVGRAVAYWERLHGVREHAPTAPLPTPSIHPAAQPLPRHAA